MFIVIDTQEMRFLPIKHESVHVCANLCTIEFPDTMEFAIESLGEGFLSFYDNVQLFRLYKSMTGEHPKLVNQQLRNALYHMVKGIPDFDCRPEETEAQAAFLEGRARVPGYYRYNKGAKVPLCVQELFHETVQVSPLANESELCRISPTPKVATRSYVPSETKDLAPKDSPQRGVKAIIWEVATDVWQKAGAPKEQSQIMRIRRDIMPLLEAQHGIKKTTSSNELGNWMKQIIAN